MKRARTTLLLVLVIFIIFLSLPLPLSRNIKIAVIDIFSPLLEASSVVMYKIESVRSFFTDSISAVSENKRLKKENAILYDKVNKSQEAISENIRLRKLLDIKLSIPYKHVVCSVIARDTSNWFSTIVINKGIDVGLDADMPVLSNGAVVGRIVHCGFNTSVVLLLTDRGSSVGGIIRGSRTIGLVEGQGSGECIFNLIPKQVTIQRGDEIVTAGLGQIFPKGLLIGKIQEIRSDRYGLYKIAQIKLNADINSIEEVIVLVSKSR